MIEGVEYKMLESALDLFISVLVISDPHSGGLEFVEIDI